MIVNERITAYINSLEVPGSDISEQIKKEALADRVPIIRSETASLLKFFVSFAKPMQILEVGTAVGYSAIMMSEVMPEGAAITTIEKYEPRIPVARENFRRAGKEGVITLLEGDAMEWLARLSGPYDMIFMDAAKGQYIHFFPEIMRLLSDGGILISDNIFQDGDINQEKPHHTQPHAGVFIYIETYRRTGHLPDTHRGRRGGQYEKERIASYETTP